MKITSLYATFAFTAAVSLVVSVELSAEADPDSVVVRHYMSDDPAVWVRSLVARSPVQSPDQVGARERVAGTMQDELLYSTFFGGSGIERSTAGDLLYDSDGSFFVIAETRSDDLPGASGGLAADGRAEFIAKFNSSGELLWVSTYGGSSLESTRAATLDNSGNVYIVGSTVSNDFPTLDPFQAENLGAGDAFIMKFDPAGELLWSTLVGGDQNDAAVGVHIDVNGRPIVVGRSSSDPSEGNPVKRAAGAFPTSGPSIVGDGGGDDIFVMDLNPDGTGFALSYYVGGPGSEEPTSFQIASDGDYVILGEINAQFGALPTVNAFQAEYGGGGSDLFLMKVKPGAGDFVFSTYLGGSSDEAPVGLAITGQDHVIVAGLTESSDLPLIDPLVGTLETPSGGTLSDFAPDGSVAFTGYAPTAAGDIAAGLGEEVIITGTGNSSNVPIVNPLPGGDTGSGAYMTRFDASTKEVTFSSLYSKGLTLGSHVATRPNGDFLLLGTSLNGDIPLVNAIQNERAGGWDLFIAAVGGDFGGGDPSFSVSPDPIWFEQVSFGNVGQEEVTIENTGTEAFEISSVSVGPDPPFSLEGHPSEPIMLQPGAELSFFVIYAPRQDALSKTADDGLLQVFTTLGLLKEIPIQTFFVREVPTIGIVLARRNLQSHPVDSRRYDGLSVLGSGLGLFDEIELPGIDNVTIQDAEFSDEAVTFDILLGDEGEPPTGEYDLILRNSTYDREVNVTETIGAKFAVVLGLMGFNQAIVARDIESPYKHVLVAGKRGAFRVQLGGDRFLNETFAGKLFIDGVEQTTFSDILYKYKAPGEYSLEEIFDGADFLTSTFIEPAEGTHTFKITMTRADERRLIGPNLRRETRRSRRLNILAISFRVRLPDGSIVEPMPESTISTGLTSFADMYPLSEDQIHITYIDNEDLPRSFPTTELQFEGETINVLSTDDQIRLLGRLGRGVTHGRSVAQNLLDAIEVDRTYDAVIAILPERLLYRDEDGDQEVDKQVAGRADPDRRSVIVTQSDGISGSIAHEIGHIIASIVESELPPDTRVRNMGDQYASGTFECDVNPPVDGLVDQYGVTCIADPPLRNGFAGDESGLFTGTTAFDVRSGRARHTRRSPDPDDEVKIFNFMGAARSDASTWVGDRTYNLLYPLLIPGESGNSPKHTPEADPGIRVVGFVKDDGTVEFDDPLLAETSFRSPEADGAAEYAIQLKDDSDALLAEHAIEIRFIEYAEPPSPTDRASFSAVLDFPSTTKHVVVSKNGSELGRISLSGNAPVVSDLTTGSSSGDQNINISWTASDPDGDSLSFSVMYIPDDGPPIPIAADLAETSIVWNSSRYPSSFDGRIAIVASDGFNLGMADAPLGTVIGVGIDDSQPEEFEIGLSASYPNPMQSSTEIEIRIPKLDGFATNELAIYDMLGRQVRVLKSGATPAGTYRVRWDGRDTSGREVSNGVYLYRLRAGGFVKTRALVVAR